MAKTEKKSSVLDAAIAEMNTKYGPGSVGRLGNAGVVPVDVVSSGILPLDLALGCGGFPRGRISEIYGPESGGKTTITLQTIAEGQAMGLNCAFIDVEHALDSVYATAIGVNMDDLVISQPDTAEQALEIVEGLARTGEVGVIVLDSVAALVPRAEVEGDMGDAHVGLHARLMSQALRKLNGAVSNGNTALLFINQIREKIGVMYGSPEVTTGGRALKFYASVRIDVRRIETLKTGQEATANRTRAKIVKNKVGIPYKQAEFDLVFGHGVPKTNALADVAIELGVIKKSGSWFSYLGESLGQGKNGAVVALEDAATFQSVRNDVDKVLAGNGEVEIFGGIDEE